MKKEPMETACTETACAGAVGCGKRKKALLSGVTAVVAVVAAVTLVLAGVLAGDGLREPVTVEAAGDKSGPKTGTLDFYYWQRLIYIWTDVNFYRAEAYYNLHALIPDAVKGEWHPILPIYSDNHGNRYAATGEIQDGGNYEGTLKTIPCQTLSAYIDPNADDFITRTIPPHSLGIAWKELWRDDDTSYMQSFALLTEDGKNFHMNSLPDSGDYNLFTYDTTCNFQDRWGVVFDGGVTIGNQKFYRKGFFRNNDKSVTYYNFYDTLVLTNPELGTEGAHYLEGERHQTGSVSDEQIAARTADFFVATKKTYTCINENWSIGANQVYTADADLFLKDGVTLTVPTGAVLCVKKGAFYVNGTIDCYGTILVEDGGIIMPYEAIEGKGCAINLRKGGTMLIEEGGRVYAGCPAGQLGTKENGWLDMYEGSTLLNYGLLVAGSFDSKLNGSGGGSIENHPGGAMFLGYTVSDPAKFQSAKYSLSGADTSTLMSTLGLATTSGSALYRDGITFLKTWNGSYLATANNEKKGKIKLYAYDKDYKYTESLWTPN